MNERCLNCREQMASESLQPESKASQTAPESLQSEFESSRMASRLLRTAFESSLLASESSGFCVGFAQATSIPMSASLSDGFSKKWRVKERLRTKCDE